MRVQRYIFDDGADKEVEFVVERHYLADDVRSAEIADSGILCQQDRRRIVEHRRITGDVVEVEDLEESGIHKTDLLIEPVRIDRDQVLADHRPGRVFDIGQFGFDDRRDRRPCRIDAVDAEIGSRRNDRADGVCARRLFKKRVVRPLVVCDQAGEDEDRHAHRQPGDVDRRV